MSNDGKMMIDDKKKNTEDREGADAPLDIGQQDMLAGIRQLDPRHQDTVYFLGLHQVNKLLWTLF